MPQLDSAVMRPADPPARPQRSGPVPSPALPPPAWRWIAGWAGLLLVTLTVFGGRYGYHRDELYFRMIGRHLRWGYFDQPPLTPALGRLSMEVFGDGHRALRLPGALCLVVAVVLMALLARELGGGRGAQLISMAGVTLAPYPLAAGNALITNIVDLPFWLGAALCALRALRRGDGRWWVAAGAVVGLATYNKHLIAFLVVGLAAGLTMVGPRRVVADRWLWAGAALALLLAVPGLAYQATHGWPQLEMARTLSADFGGTNRAMFVPLQFLLIGPAGAVVAAAGLVLLARTPGVRAFAVAYPVAGLLVLAGGGRADYVFGLLLVCYAAGSVATARWMARARARVALVAVAGAVGAVVAVVGALSPLPVDVVARTPLPAINALLRDSVGWPAYVRQIADVYQGLPAEERARAAIVVSNYGEAGALDRYGPDHGLPTAYSGHHELHRQGPPPASADVVVAVGLRPEVLRAAFERCAVAGTLDSGVSIDNREEGRSLLVCRGLRGSWAQLWPRFWHAHSYG
ncbi:4-amino-4-deoxy-L-arabinose transferase [Thermomonospora echinospora]|uniref:4-amino-4-deoxy-L-arabinose transferase n=1 Tax=Thermomonospora echinospora TaxID=1992 RepID=A0A1H5VIS0_9ACTN|nr:glycosyltransferase family 39 protein [Thermomonospora echinospora]SEF86427.1 4-amino-4-deoxy-L-arabinose transferase [Thermomonospora echinospora]